MAVSGRTTVSRSPRAHDAVLDKPTLEALLAEVVRAKQGLEAMADGVEGAMAHEGRAQQRAKNKIVAQRVEALGILERGSLRGRRLHFESARTRGYAYPNFPTTLEDMYKISAPCVRRARTARFRFAK